MTNQQIETINAAIDTAITAMPNGDEHQLNDWIEAHVPLPADVNDALADERLKTIIRERARKLGVKLSA